MTNEPTDILFVTVNEHETNALLTAFYQATKKKGVTFTLGNRVFQRLGVLNGHNCVLTITEMGSGGVGATQQAVNDSIAALDPSFICSVGIAFGVNEKKQKIGDILVSKQLLLYELQKRSAVGITLRGDKPHSSPLLLQLFRNAHQTWEGDKVRFGLILSGEKLIDNVDYRNELIELETEAIGGEMEGAGLYTPCQTHKKDWILVKAICDWADGKKSQRKTARQQKAAKNAADYVVHSLSNISLKDENKTKQEKKTSKTKIIVDFAKVDAALGRWLSERLTLRGYDVWNRVTAPILGETLDEIYGRLIEEQTSHVIALLSNKALHNDEFKERRMLAGAAGVTIIPIEVDEFDDRKVERSLRDVSRTNFADGWGPGYDRLLKTMVDNQLVPDASKEAAFYAFEDLLIKAQPETLVSNQFEVIQSPPTFKRFKVKEELSAGEKAAMALDWPCVEFDSYHYLSFFEPTTQVKKEFGLNSAKALANSEDSFESWQLYRNAIVELLKKSFYHHCKLNGLVYCSVNDYVYFPQGHAKIKMRTITGKSVTSMPTGERTFRQKDVFYYQIAPLVDVVINKAGFWLTVKLRIRLTNKGGMVLKPLAALARRKVVCKNWWNDEWLKRTMAVMQFLAKDGVVTIGGPANEALKVNALPDVFEIPVSLDEVLLNQNKEDDRDEVLTDNDSDSEFEWEEDEEVDEVLDDE